MQAPIHASESESVMPRIIAVVAGLAILGAVVIGFVAFTGAWSPPATTSMTHSQPAS
ncbi:MAG TPA: hypothetical protein VLW75_02465 [Rhizomicrobium sp.]|nr:hypothetical protein [Rhizomicrobium sp.]